MFYFWLNRAKFASLTSISFHCFPENLELRFTTTWGALRDFRRITLMQKHVNVAAILEGEIVQMIAVLVGLKTT